MEPPPKQKFRAFRKIQPKPSQYRSEEVLSHFLSEQEDLAKFVSDSRQLDLGRIRFWNPFLKGVLFTVSSGLLLIGAHNRRHLWQAERVKEATGSRANYRNPQKSIYHGSTESTEENQIKKISGSPW